ncbi:MAG TPA: AAA family ATPase, partial [Caulifigura sp.]|nr:AAA family ATPase [Caulifigura sp.]
MKLTDLSIDHFGALSKFSLPEIAPGLNVLHGPNGSGKTTLVQFIRGVFAGFDEARRRQLIPPVGSETAGGTIGIEWGSRRMAVIRHGRPDEYETLAINVRQGQSDEGQSLRKHIEAFDDERLSVLFTAGSFDANSVEALIRLARTDGLDLSTVPGNERPISARLTHLHSQRASLLRHAPPAGRRAELQAQREAIAAEKLAIQRQADERRAELLRARVALDERLAIVDVEIDQLFLEFQALETDLSECESRLWASRQPVLDVVYVQETIPPGLNPRLPEVEELDRRIEHVRTVLKDLAASRHQLSIEAANAAGSDVPDRLAFAARQRESLRVMQMQLHALSGTAQWLETASHQGTCVCETVHERLASVVDEMRRQVELSCQELSRQQTAWQLEQRRADLASLDQTEQGLERQLNWLRLRREELLEEAAHPTLSRLAHTVTAERQFCGCPEHTATMRATTPRVVTRRTVQERHDQSAAPPEDLACHTALIELKSAAWNAWQTAMARSCDLELQRRRLISAFHAIDIAPALADCEHRLAAIQRQLEELDAQLAELAALDAEIRTLESQLVRDQSSRLISEASENLELLTLSRYRALRIGTDGMTLQVIGENDSPYVASALSRGTLFQVALALRIALVDEYARRGLEFPLVLDDVLVDSDEHRLEAAAQLLSAAAERGRQILFLTCQDHLVDMLEDRGAAVHSLPGSIRTHG